LHGEHAAEALGGGALEPEESGAIHIDRDFGERISTAKVTVNVDGPALLWFQSAASQSFGGMFTVQVPFVVQGEANQDLTGKIQSISVTATNDLGSSSPMVVEVNR
jgi:hypothetical protein